MVSHGLFGIISCAIPAILQENRGKSGGDLRCAISETGRDTPITPRMIRATDRSTCLLDIALFRCWRATVAKWNGKRISGRGWGARFAIRRAPGACCRTPVLRKNHPAGTACWKYRVGWGSLRGNGARRRIPVAIRACTGQMNRYFIARAAGVFSA